ncbi:hypothetical protein IW261DRAFT_1511528 [Armillaria novae-zelandiae]|uniref:Uncharacterized protein n=1 Tax=Armillaria novae-zelandiae TaxID=153914 RepID=A0AA39UAJ1_9AGAR|nr:hypothetical protein IW261DRAFT_1511528 [Armillaria novae-zelandiae]
MKRYKRETSSLAFLQSPLNITRASQSKHRLASDTPTSTFDTTFLNLAIVMSFDMFSLMQRRAQGRRAGGGGGGGAQASGFGGPGGFSSLLSGGGASGFGGLDPKAFTAFPGMSPASSFSPNSSPPAHQQTHESSSGPSESPEEPSASPLAGGPAGNLSSLTNLGGFGGGIFESFLGSKTGGGQ